MEKASRFWTQGPETDPETAGEEFKRKLFFLLFFIFRTCPLLNCIFYYFKAFFSKNPGTCEYPNFNVK